MASNNPPPPAGSIRRLALPANLALVAAPIYLWQGWRVRQKTPRLPEAPGPRHGTIDGSHPPIRLLGIGESPLAGVGLANQTQTLIALLATELASSTRRCVRWSTAARGGVIAAETLAQLLPRLPADPADLVVIGLGVNDCLRLRSARRWENDLVQLLDNLRMRVNPTKVIITGVPPMQHFPALPRPLSTMLGLRARLLDAASARLAAQRQDLIHVPMDLDAQNEALFCRDGFHPSPIGHQRWAEQLAPFALKSL